MADKLKLDSGIDYLNLDSSGDDLLLELSVTELITLDFTSSGNLTLDILKLPSTDPIVLGFDGTGSYSIDVNAKVPISLGFSASASYEVQVEPLGKVGAGTTLVDLEQTVALVIVSNLSVSDTLFLTDVVSEGTDFVKSLSHTLTISQSVSGGLIHNESASDTLTITDSAVSARLVEDTLIITDSAVGILGFEEGIASDTLSITDLAELDTILSLSASNILTITDTVNLDLVTSKSIFDNLYFIDQAFGILLNSKKYVLLQAPYDFIQTTLVLPSPLFQDTENLISNINLRRSMNGQTYTYVKSSDSKILKYTFSLPRMKGVALEEFCRSYNSTPIKLTNWKGEVWNVQIMTNPTDFVETGRYEPTTDRTDVNLEFEGTKVYG